MPNYGHDLASFYLFALSVFACFANVLYKNHLLSRERKIVLREKDLDYAWQQLNKEYEKMEKEKQQLYYLRGFGKIK